MPCCKSADLETIWVVLLPQERRGDGRNGVGWSWWQHISEVFSVIFETWVSRAGRNLFLSAFCLYMFPHVSLLTRLLWSRCCIREKWLLHLLSHGQSWFLKLKELKQTVGGSTADCVKTTVFPLAVMACITFLHFWLKWWCKLEGVNL